MARKIAATKLWESATMVGSGTNSGVTTSTAVDIQEADAMALHVTAISGTTPSITFTYTLAPTLNGPFTKPVAGVTIGTAIAAVDVLDFAPEAAGAIKIVATNNGTGAVVLTSYLVVQEAA
jgi:hypothetical protein